VGYRSSVLIVILVFGILFSMLYFAKPTDSNNIPTTPRISNAQAVGAVEDYLNERVRRFETISLYYGESTPDGKTIVQPKYYLASEFLDNGYDLWVRYYHPNSTLFYLKADEQTGDYIIVGKCNDAQENPCIPPNPEIRSLLSGHLVYLLDTAWIYREENDEHTDLPDGFYVDAISGKVLYSTFYCFKEQSEWCKVETTREKEWGIKTHS
jgi:hypothetical protein